MRVTTESQILNQIRRKGGDQHDQRAAFAVYREIMLQVLSNCIQRPFRFDLNLPFCLCCSRDSEVVVVVVDNEDEEVEGASEEKLSISPTAEVRMFRKREHISWRWFSFICQVERVII